MLQFRIAYPPPRNLTRDNSGRTRTPSKLPTHPMINFRAVTTSGVCIKIMTSNEVSRMHFVGAELVRRGIASIKP